MLKKFGTLYLIILLSTLLSGLYGVFHDQITYSISPEYYTKFKFYQFGLEDYFADSQRIGVSIVGFQATWWMGLIIGIILGLVSFLHQHPKRMFKTSMQSLGVVLLVTIFIPLVWTPIYFGQDFLNGVNIEQYAVSLPEFVPKDVAVIHHFSFFMVGVIHSLSYLGGIIGILAGIMFHVWKHKASKNLNSATA